MRISTYYKHANRYIFGTLDYQPMFYQTEDIRTDSLSVITSGAQLYVENAVVFVLLLKILPKLQVTAH